MSDAVWLGFIGLLGLIVKDWLDQRRANRNAKKIDDNTKLTIEQGEDAASAARSAEGKVDNLTVKMNGEFEGKVRDIVTELVAPIHEAIKEHSLQDEHNMGVVIEAIKQISLPGAEKVAEAVAGKLDVVVESKTIAERALKHAHANHDHQMLIEEELRVVLTGQHGAEKAAAIISDIKAKASRPEVA